MKRRLILATVSLVMGVTSFSSPAQNQDSTKTTLPQDQCQATYSTSNQILTIPCVKVDMQGQSIAYQVVLKQTADSFSLQSAIETALPFTIPSKTLCQANYSLVSGKLEVPCIDGMESITNLTLQAQNFTNPSLFLSSGELSNRRATSNNFLPTIVNWKTACNTGYSNGANYLWFNIYRPTYEQQLSYLKGEINDIEDSHKRADFIKSTIVNALLLLDVSKMSATSADFNKELIKNYLGISTMLMSGTNDNGNLLRALISNLIDEGLVISTFLDPTASPLEKAVTLMTFLYDKGSDAFFGLWDTFFLWDSSTKQQQLATEMLVLDTMHRHCSMTDIEKNSAVKQLLPSPANSSYYNIFDDCPFVIDPVRCLLYKINSSIDVIGAASKIWDVWNMTHNISRRSGFDQYITSFDGAGSLIETEGNSSGANHDVVLLRPHGIVPGAVTTGRLSTAVFQVSKRTQNCDHVDISATSNNRALSGDVLIQTKNWADHLMSPLTSYKGQLPISVFPLNDNFMVISITPTSPLTNTVFIHAECKPASETGTTALRNYSVSTYVDLPLVSLDNDYFWTGTGSVMSHLGYGTGKTVDSAPTFDKHKSFTSFQWSPSSSCKQLKIFEKSHPSQIIDFTDDNEVAIKQWNSNEWTQQCLQLPCIIDAPSIDQFYIVKAKTNAGAISSGYLQAQCQ